MVFADQAAHKSYYTVTYVSESEEEESPAPHADSNNNKGTAFIAGAITNIKCAGHRTQLLDF